MTSSFFIRTSKTNPSATIYLRITESRGNQYRFNTGHRLNKSSSWNYETQSVRTVANESYDLIKLQLRRLKAHLETKAVSAKSDRVHLHCHGRAQRGNVIRGAAAEITAAVAV